MAAKTSLNRTMYEDTNSKSPCSVNLDKLLEDFSQIEKTFAEVNGNNNLLEIQLEKRSRMWKISQTKQLSLAEECTALQEVIKGLQETIELQFSMRDENSNLKKKVNTLEEKLQDVTQEYKKNIDSLMNEMRKKEENSMAQVQKIQREMEEKLLTKEEEKHNLLSTKDKEISDLWIQLRTQEKEKQKEMIKQQIEFNAKLARIQSKNSKSYPDTNSLSHNIYRTKLQHLQEEKNKEIEILRNTIKDLERRLSSGSDSRLKRKRF
ncbi:coiled-coil domain-containing protein 152 isoform X2 [Hyla sarda]|uniref:coiled-coil domain-containing protein 152 isoform X2 n=1 Tax=Hyla sarda TaxID=327740 RepID=UPI0024C35CC2|nr:coiled-coil domain-containing protein 152 isoform X2 [Hyla sarda]